MIENKIITKWSNDYKGREVICIENVLYDKYIILFRNEICVILDYSTINGELFIMVKSTIDGKVVIAKSKYFNIR